MKRTLYIQIDELDYQRLLKASLIKYRSVEKLINIAVDKELDDIEIDYGDLLHDYTPELEEPEEVVDLSHLRWDYRQH